MPGKRKKRKNISSFLNGLARKDKLDHLTSYFLELRNFQLLSAKEEKELFRRNEKNIISILCELMMVSEFWEELGRILEKMIQTAEFPTELFDITKADYDDLEKKSNYKKRKELADKITATMVKMANLYKASKFFENMGKKKEAARKIDEIAKLRRSIGITLDFIHHMRTHIFQWYEKMKEEDKLKNMEIKKVEEIINNVKKISRKMKDETRTLYSSNLRLAITVAKKYHIHNTDLLDFIQEGNMALAKAIEKFDWRKGTKFSTYAVPWLRQAIMRAMNERIHPVRMPGHIVELLNKINKVTRKFFQENGRDPSIDELAEILKVPVEKIETIFKILKEPLSFEGYNPEWEEDGHKLSDLVPSSSPDDVCEEIFDSVVREDIKRKVREIIDSTLTTKEKKIIEMRCGFINGGKESTLDEISTVLNMTRERVRQIEQRAMRKLRKALEPIRYLFDNSYKDEESRDSREKELQKTDMSENSTDGKKVKKAKKKKFLYSGTKKPTTRRKIKRTIRRRNIKENANISI